MKISIRPAREQDAPIIARIHVDSWRAAYRGLVPDEFLNNLSYSNREDIFRKAIAAGQEETYLVLAQDRPAGRLTIGACRDADVDTKRTGEIWGIYLLPEFWRCGIGTQLVRIAEEMLQQRGFDQIVLWVFEGNNRARRFYESAGYHPDGASKDLDRGKILAVIRYRKTLSSVPTSV